MAVRIGFSIIYPPRMGDLSGQYTRFPERILSGMEGVITIGEAEEYLNIIRKYNDYELKHEWPHPKTTTIRSNYDYWKKFEGKMIQPFFWSGKPRRSKHVVFCPEVKLERVQRIGIYPHSVRVYNEEGENFNYLSPSIQRHDLEILTQSEGFDRPEHFFRWFNKDFVGAILTFGE